MIQRNQTAKDIIKQCLFKGAIEIVCAKIKSGNYEMGWSQTEKDTVTFVTRMEEQLFNIKGETGVKINL